MLLKPFKAVYGNQKPSKKPFNDSNCTSWISKGVVSCTMNKCLLYPYRLSKGNQDAAKRQKDIRAYCFWCVHEQVSEISKCPFTDCALFIYRKDGVEKSLVASG